MAILRLANGTDLMVKLSIEDTLSAISAISTSAGERDFVELPGEDGPVHLRPSGVIAVIDEPRRHASGFRFGTESGTAR
ncbi:MAG: hypothetical protein ABR564_08490 [Candidatus Dormibacteria bacterium]